MYIPKNLCLHCVMRPVLSNFTLSMEPLFAPGSQNCDKEHLVLRVAQWSYSLRIGFGTILQLASASEGKEEILWELESSCGKGAVFRRFASYDPWKLCSWM